MWCELNLSAPIQNYPKPLFEQRLFAILPDKANLSGLDVSVWNVWFLEIEADNFSIGLQSPQLQIMEKVK